MWLIVILGQLQVLHIIYINVQELDNVYLSISIGIYFNLDGTGTPTLNPLTVDLPFTHCFFHVIFFPASSIARTAVCLAC